MKSRVSKGLPKELYTGAQNRRFYAWAEALAKRYGILSDLYGLHLDEEVLPRYDVHPSELDYAAKSKLAALVHAKAVAAGFDAICFYNSSPVLSKPYFEILAQCGLATFFVTSLPVRKKLHQ